MENIKHMHVGLARKSKYNRASFHSVFKGFLTFYTWTAVSSFDVEHLDIIKSTHINNGENREIDNLLNISLPFFRNMLFLPANFSEERILVTRIQMNCYQYCEPGRNI